LSIDRNQALGERDQEPRRPILTLPVLEGVRGPQDDRGGESDLPAMEVNDVLRVGLHVLLLLTLEQTLDLQAQASHVLQGGVTPVLLLILSFPRVLGELEELSGHHAALELVLIDGGAIDQMSTR